jgi:hypothetical protein
MGQLRSHISANKEMVAFHESEKEHGLKRKKKGGAFAFGETGRVFSLFLFLFFFLFFPPFSHYSFSPFET